MGSIRCQSLSLIHISPWLFAAYRVLRRLPVPRHSPCALFSLTNYVFFRFSLGFFSIVVVFTLLFFDTLPLISFASLFSFQSTSLNIQLLFTRVSLPFWLIWLTPSRVIGFFPLSFLLSIELVVGSSGLEPPTSRLSGARSNRLSYEPILPGYLGVLFQLFAP